MGESTASTGVLQQKGNECMLENSASSNNNVQVAVSFPWWQEVKTELKVLAVAQKKLEEFTAALGPLQARLRATKTPEGKGIQ